MIKSINKAFKKYDGL